MKIAIIGAGVAGIVSLKYASEKGHECDCFEETGEFGGTWVYTDKTGVDENGNKIYRTMYKDLITNLPKDVMVFLDFPYPQHVKDSFINQKQVLQYLTDYVTKFNLENRIKYHEAVTRVQPLPNNKWTVTSKNTIKKTENSSVYDAVFVCNGHFRHPKMPNVFGQNLFKGQQMHSSEYRNSTLFKDKRVLIIGASYSATDVINQIENVTKKIYLSHWKPTNLSIKNVLSKPAVAQLRSESAVFVDGSNEDIDIVVYCTGYEYAFPFLDESCGIAVEDNWVRPLYKHIINIQHPTMFLIGIPFLVPAFLICDLHARFALSVLENKLLVPSKQDMLKELDDHMSNLKANNIPQRHVHKIGYELESYFADLVKITSIRPFPPVLTKLYMHKIKNPGKENVRYIVLDEKNFISC